MTRSALSLQISTTKGARRRRRRCQGRQIWSISTSVAKTGSTCEPISFEWNAHLLASFHHTSLATPPFITRASQHRRPRARAIFVESSFTVLFEVEVKPGFGPVSVRGDLSTRAGSQSTAVTSCARETQTVRWRKGAKSYWTALMRCFDAARDDRAALAGRGKRERVVMGVVDICAVHTLS